MNDPRRKERKAFVLELEELPPEGSNRLQGRVEHLASGREAQVGSVEELLAFLRGGKRAAAAGGPGGSG